MAAPDFTFHVVLEEHAGKVEAPGKIDGGIEEVADGDIEALVAVPSVDLLLDCGVGKTADRIGRVGAEMREIVDAPCRSRKFGFTGANGHGAGQLALQLTLVVGVGRSSIVGVERKLMASGQISQDVVRADIAAVLHGKELVGF